MFTNRQTQEIEVLVVIASTVAKDRERLGALLTGLTERFLGHTVRVRLVDGPDVVHADLVVVTEQPTDFRGALAARDDESICFLNVGASEPGGSWNVITSEEELPGRAREAINRGLEGRFAHEERLDDPSTKKALVLGARLEIMSHVQAHWGEAQSEYTLAELPHDRPYFFALECSARRERPFWSYATIGLSLKPQASLPDFAPYVELVAYSPVADRRVADVLFAAASLITNAEAGDPPLKPLDTIDLSGAGLCHDLFVLAPAPEPESFALFPSTEPLSAQIDAGRSGIQFNLVVNGTETPSCRVSFLQLVPVTEEQLHAARTDPTTVLAKLERTNGRRAEGWTSLARRTWWKFWEN